MNLGRLVYSSCLLPCLPTYQSLLCHNQNTAHRSCSALPTLLPFVNALCCKGCLNRRWKSNNLQTKVNYATAKFTSKELRSRDMECRCRRLFWLSVWVSSCSMELRHFVTVPLISTRYTRCLHRYSLHIHICRNPKNMLLGNFCHQISCQMHAIAMRSSSYVQQYIDQNIFPFLPQNTSSHPHPCVIQDISELYWQIHW